ncbi:MAG TPA: ABC transporter permease [Stellaceae bacterium]|nr:ABC transporter permease [Stellaceae bacterium]
MASTHSPSVAAFGGSAAREARFEISAGLGWPERFRLAIEDLREAAAMWQLAWTLSLLDIKLRYRGSLLGPFWLTLSTTVMIATMGFVYSYLFRTEMKSYFPFLAFSIIFWNFLSGMMLDGCNTFIQAEAVIKGMKLPFAHHALRTVFRNLIVLAHNIVVVVAVFVLFRVPIDRFAVLAVPGFLLWLVDGFLACLLFGVICTRFRDVPQIIQSILQIVFFVTPIMWQPSLVKGHPAISLIIAINPFEALLQIVRAPLLGDHLGLLAWAVALLFSGLLLVGSVLLFARARGRIAFWI